MCLERLRTAVGDAKGVSGVLVDRQRVDGVEVNEVVRLVVGTGKRRSVGLDVLDVCAEIDGFVRAR